MKYYLIAALVVCFSFFLPAQDIDQHQVDSLEQLLVKMPEDTNKFKVYVALNDIFFYADYKRSIGYMEKARTLSKAIGYTKGLAYTLNELGYLFSQSGENEKGILYSLQSARESFSIQDSIGLSQSYNNLGYLYKLTGKIDSSLWYYQRSLAIKEKKGPEKSLAYAYLNMGYMYHTHVNRELGLQYYRKALALSRKAGDAYMESQALNNIAFVLNASGKTDSALAYYEQALAMAIKNNDQSFIGKLYNNLSALEEKKGNLKKAEHYLVQSLRINKEIGNFENLSVATNRMATLLLDQKKYSDAKAYALESVNISKEHKLSESLQSGYYTLSKAYEGLRQFEEALASYTKYTALKDSFFNIQNTKVLSENEAKYQNEKKQLAIQNLEKEGALRETQLKKQTQQKIFFAAGFLLMGIAAFFIFRSYRQKRKDHRIITEKNRETERQKAIIEEKQKEIVDSIEYAKRIQNALITSEMYIARNLKRLNSKR